MPAVLIPKRLYTPEGATTGGLQVNMTSFL
jgi:hypothetical protein